MTSTTTESLTWLIDRAQVHDLLLAYARCVDTKDWDSFADLFAPEGELVTPFGSIGHDQLARAIESMLRPFGATHHMFANIGIEIDGDIARSNHYLQATHLPDPTVTGAHAVIGGWYNNTYRRTDNGWRFVTIDLSFVWSDGMPFEPGDPHP